MTKKVYLKFELKEFRNNVMFFQVLEQDERFKDIDYGNLKSCNAVSIAPLDDKNIIYLKGSSKLNYSSYNIKKHSKEQILEMLRQFPLHEKFDEDFKKEPYEIELHKNYAENIYSYVIKSPSTPFREVLKFKLWDFDGRRFFQILSQDEDLRNSFINIKDSKIKFVMSYVSKDYPIFISDTICLRGSLSELDKNVSWNYNEHNFLTIPETLNVVKKSLENFYNRDLTILKREPKIEEIEPDLYEVYCEG